MARSKRTPGPLADFTEAMAFVSAITIVCGITYGKLDYDRGIEWRKSQEAKMENRDNEIRAIRAELDAIRKR